MKDKVINVLMIAQGGHSFGGVENFFYQYYKKMDQGIIHCDFGFCRGNSMVQRYEEPLFENSQFIVFSDFSHKTSIENYMTLYQSVYKFLKDNKYDIVHINTGNIFIQVPCLAAAHRAGISRIITHSHSTVGRMNGNLIVRVMKEIYRKVMRTYVVNMSTLCFACGKEAGEQLFGKKTISSDKFHVIPNAFDIDLYRYDENKRRKIRKNLGVGVGTKVIGTVGRLSEVKNPFFAIRVFSEVSKLCQDAIFWMIGDGVLKEKLEQFAIQKGIGEKVYFWGMRKDIPDFLLAMDVFLMPSIYEGLGIAAVEAQASGLPCVLSDTIPSETKITKFVKYISINESPKVWATEILNMCNFERKVVSNRVRAAGYDIKDAAIYLQNKYVELVRKN